jgi:hypothetical protein
MIHSGGNKPAGMKKLFCKLHEILMQAETRSARLLVSRPGSARIMRRREFSKQRAARAG